MNPPEDSHLPQRLDEIMATLHSRLGSEVEVRDYHFVISAADRHHITHDGFPQLARLKEAFRCTNISVHFNPITGELSVSTLGGTPQCELQHLLMRKMRVAIATNPHMANTLHVAPFLEGNALEPEVPHCLVALYRSDGELECDGNMLPSLVINVSIFAGERNNKRVEKSKSAPAHVMTRHPSIQTIVRLDLGGLTIGRSVRREHHERRIQRIADLSSILTWTRDKHGDIVNTCESLSKEDGELRLCLLSGNDSSNASGQDVEVVLKYSEIVDAIRMGGRFGPLGGVPKDNHPPAPSTTLQATVVPFPSFFHRHALASLSNADIAARAARLLGLGNKTTTTPETTMLGGREGAGVFRPLPYAAIQTRAAAVAPWGRVLARLGRKF